MKKILLFICSLISVSTVSGQCTALFSFGANFETVNFYNQSNVSNAHYFWNFGDGIGSNLKNPIHKYSETGNYMVTLFAKDTLSNCSAYYDFWINVTKFSTDSCQPISVIDSIFPYNNSYYLQLTDNSVNCNNYTKILDGGSSQNFQYIWWVNLPFTHSRYLSRIRYRKYDSTFNQVIDKRMVYKSIPYNYTSTKNYDSCSANFEFKAISQAGNQQRILFTAMNKSAASYEWALAGFGNPVYSSSDTISHLYPLNIDMFWYVFLKTTGQTGCKDSLCQTIRTQDIKNTFVGIKENKADKLLLNIYPNPSHNLMFIESKVEIKTLVLTNALGQTILILNNPTPKQEIDVSQLPSGVYFLKAENKEAKGVFKVVKE